MRSSRVNQFKTTIASGGETKIAKMRNVRVILLPFTLFSVAIAHVYFIPSYNVIGGYWKGCSNYRGIPSCFDGKVCTRVLENE